MMFRWRKLLILWILVVVVATTLPWSGLQGLQRHSHWDNVRWIPFYSDSFSARFILDMTVNLLLFVPFGYFYVRSRPSVHGAVFLRVILMAALFSVGVELVQVFSHTRIPSMTDICTNVIGATIGAAMGKQWIKSSAPSSSYEEA